MVTLGGKSEVAQIRIPGYYSLKICKLFKNQSNNNNVIYVAFY